VGEEGEDSLLFLLVLFYPFLFLKLAIEVWSWTPPQRLVGLSAVSFRFPVG